MTAGSSGPDAGTVIKALHRYTDEAASRPDLLEEPVRGCDLLSHAPQIEVLTHWAIFNPMGPTVSAVFVASIPDDDRRLLGHCILNPFHSEHVVSGLFDSGNQSREEIREEIKSFFNQNGGPKIPVLQSLPTLIWPSSQGLFSLPECATLVHRTLVNVPPEDLQQTARKLVEMRGKPWERNPPGEVFGVDSGNQPEPFAGRWPPPWDVFQAWYLSVMNAEHCKAEAPHIEAAWNGSISFQEKMGNQEMADAALSWGAAQQFMHRMLSHAIRSNVPSDRLSRNNES
jgi:hypothetical protein